MRAGDTSPRVYDNGPRSNKVDLVTFSLSLQSDLMTCKTYHGMIILLHNLFYYTLTVINNKNWMFLQCKL